MVAVEELLAEASQFRSDLPEDQVDALKRLVGCYILEVGRRSFGGVYYWNDARQQPVLVVGEPHTHIAIMTWDKVVGRPGGDTADNIPFFYKGFASRAAKAAPGDRVLFV